MKTKDLITWGVPIATLVIVALIYHYTKPQKSNGQGSSSGYGQGSSSGYGQGSSSGGSVYVPGTEQDSLIQNDK